MVNAHGCRTINAEANLSIAALSGIQWEKFEADATAHGCRKINAQANLSIAALSLVEWEKVEADATACLTQVPVRFKPLHADGNTMWNAPDLF